MATQRRSSNAVLPGSWNESNSTVSSASSSSPSPHASPAPPPRTPSPSLAALRPTPSFLDKPPSYSPTITPTFVHAADPRAFLHRLEQQLDEAARNTQRLARALADADAAVDKRVSEVEAREGGRVRELEQRVKELEDRLASAVSRDQREAELLEAIRQIPAGPFLFRMTRVWAAMWKL
ncbi:hypothetical protein K525DRAFT_281353 [Schizophyllum commune Loenen D]|nr:hypothetical protein K525DRAFT_281353 [Schizophyllum commune Loenen D]